MGVRWGWIPIGLLPLIWRGLMRSAPAYKIMDLGSVWRPLLITIAKPTYNNQQTKKNTNFKIFYIIKLCLRYNVLQLHSYPHRTKTLQWIQGICSVVELNSNWNTSSNLNWNNAFRSSYTLPFVLYYCKRFLKIVLQSPALGVQNSLKTNPSPYIRLLGLRLTQEVETKDANGGK